MSEQKKHIFIIGSKGIPANYGGFETFVEQLTKLKKNKNIQYYVSCLSDNNDEFKYNNSVCINIKVPNIGPAKAIYYDVVAFKRCIKYIKNNNIKKPTIYILACRIGPFIKKLKKKLKKLGGKLYINPDGHEWKRAKWNAVIRKYWKHSEKLMVKNADLLICDSINIEKYIRENYSKFSPQTTFIAYGAYIEKSKLQDDSKELIDWYSEKGISAYEYYLIVGRFVPENNYETMIREFIKSSSEKSLVIITNIEQNKFYENLLKTTDFSNDKRIKFVGTLYDEQLLKKVRECAYGYFHGHEVGGTNPSLLEALGSTRLNLLLDVGFNREVAEDAGLYWNKEEGMLASIIDKADKLLESEIIEYENKAKQRINQHYSWNYIIDKYEKVFMR